MKDIPGLYFDAERNRYFKLPPGGRPPPAAGTGSSSGRASTALREEDSAAHGRQGSRQQGGRRGPKGSKRGQASQDAKTRSQAIYPQGRPRLTGVLIRRETGMLPGGPEHFSHSTEEVRAASCTLLDTLDAVQNSRAAIGATSVICPLLAPTQTDSGLKELPSVVCGSLMHNFLLHLGFPPPGWGRTPALDCRYGIPAAFALGNRQGTSGVTSIAPICPDSEARAGLLVVTWLGGAGSQGEVTLHRVGPPSMDHDDAIPGRRVPEEASAAAATPRHHSLALSRVDGHSVRGSVWCAGVREDGGQVALGTNGGTLIYDLDRLSGRAAQEAGELALASNPLARFHSHGSDVLSQIYWPGGSTIVRGQRNGWIDCIDMRAPLRSSRGDIHMRLSSSVTSLRACTAHPNGLLAAGLNGHIGQWDLRVGREVLLYTGHRNSHKPFAMALPSSGNVMVASGDDNCVRTWSVSRGGRPLTLAGPWVWHPQGCTFLPPAWGDPLALVCATGKGLAALGPPDVGSLPTEYTAV